MPRCLFDEIIMFNHRPEISENISADFESQNLENILCDVFVNIIR